MIISRTPYRISFFGGGTDYPAWYRENGGQILATSIDKYCYISCRVLPPFFEHKHRIVYSVVEDVGSVAEIRHPAVREVLTWLGTSHGIEIHHDGDLPARSGLGSSSAFTVGLVHALRALRGEVSSHDRLAKDAIYVEQHLLREHVGCQDQIIAAHGGFRHVRFMRDDGYAPNLVPLADSKREALESSLMLFFTGVVRTASQIAAEQISRIPQNAPLLREMDAMVQDALAILERAADDLDDFGRLMHESWQIKKSLASNISNSTIDDLYTKAMQSGATGGKLLGAGGGGFLLFYVPYDARARVAAALSSLIHVPFRFESAGSQLIFLSR